MHWLLLLVPAATMVAASPTPSVANLTKREVHLPKWWPKRHRTACDYDPPKNGEYDKERPIVGSVCIDTAAHCFLTEDDFWLLKTVTYDEASVSSVEDDEDEDGNSGHYYNEEDHFPTFQGFDLPPETVDWESGLEGDDDDFNQTWPIESSNGTFDTFLGGNNGNNEHVWMNEQKFKKAVVVYVREGKYTHCGYWTQILSPICPPEGTDLGFERHPPKPGTIPQDVYLRKDGSSLVFVKTTCPDPQAKGSMTHLPMSEQNWRYRANNVRLVQDAGVLNFYQNLYCDYTDQRAEETKVHVEGRGWLPHALGDRLGNTGSVKISIRFMGAIRFWRIYRYQIKENQLDWGIVVNFPLLQNPIDVSIGIGMSAMDGYFAKYAVGKESCAFDTYVWKDEQPDHRSMPPSEGLPSGGPPSEGPPSEVPLPEGQPSEGQPSDEAPSHQDPRLPPQD